MPNNKSTIIENAVKEADAVKKLAERKVQDAILEKLAPKIEAGVINALRNGGKSTQLEAVANKMIAEAEVKFTLDPDSRMNVHIPDDQSIEDTSADVVFGSPDAAASPEEDLDTLFGDSDMEEEPSEDLGMEDDFEEDEGGDAEDLFADFDSPDDEGEVEEAEAEAEAGEAEVEDVEEELAGLFDGLNRNKKSSKRRQFETHCRVLSKKAALITRLAESGKLSKSELENAVHSYESLLEGFTNLILNGRKKGLIEESNKSTILVTNKSLVTLYESIEKAISKAGNYVTEDVGKVVDTLEDALSDLMDAAEEALDDVKDAVKDMDDTAEPTEVADDVEVDDADDSESDVLDPLEDISMSADAEFDEVWAATGGEEEAFDVPAEEDLVGDEMSTEEVDADDVDTDELGDDEEIDAEPDETVEDDTSYELELEEAFFNEMYNKSLGGRKVSKATDKKRQELIESKRRELLRKKRVEEARKEGLRRRLRAKLLEGREEAEAAGAAVGATRGGYGTGEIMDDYMDLDDSDMNENETHPDPVKSRPRRQDEAAILRRKLAESRLNETKARLAAMILANEALGMDKKRAAVKALDAAETINEAKAAFRTFKLALSESFVPKNEDSKETARKRALKRLEEARQRRLDRDSADGPAHTMTTAPPTSELWERLAKIK